MRRIVALGAAVLVLATSFALVGATPAAACSCAVVEASSYQVVDDAFSLSVAPSPPAGAAPASDDDTTSDDGDGSDDGFAGELVLVAGFLVVGTVAGVIAARLARRTRV